MNIQPVSQNQQQSFGMTPIYMGKHPSRARVGLQTFLFEVVTPLTRKQILQEMEQNHSRLHVNFDHTFLLTLRQPGRYNNFHNGKGFIASLVPPNSHQGKGFLDFLKGLRESAQPQITGAEVKLEAAQPKMTDAEVKDRLTKHLGFKPSRKYPTPLLG